MKEGAKEHIRPITEVTSSVWEELRSGNRYPSTVTPNRLWLKKCRFFIRHTIFSYDSMLPPTGTLYSVSADGPWRDGWLTWSSPTLRAKAMVLRPLPLMMELT